MPAEPPGGSVEIRRADRSESGELAALMHRVRLANVPAIPAPVHDLDDMRDWMREVVFERYDVWTGDCDGRIVGLLVLGRPTGSSTCTSTRTTRVAASVPGSSSSPSAS